LVGSGAAAASLCVTSIIWEYASVVNGSVPTRTFGQTGNDTLNRYNASFIRLFYPAFVGI
jgi:hypothetical protein